MDQLLDFIKTNKRTLIQVGGGVLGAVIGIGITALILSVSDEEMLDLDEEILE